MSKIYPSHFGLTQDCPCPAPFRLAAPFNSAPGGISQRCWLRHSRKSCTGSTLLTLIPCRLAEIPNCSGLLVLKPENLFSFGIRYLLISIIALLFASMATLASAQNRQNDPCKSLTNAKQRATCEALAKQAAEDQKSFLRQHTISQAPKTSTTTTKEKPQTTKPKFGKFKMRQPQVPKLPVQTIKPEQNNNGATNNTLPSSSTTTSGSNTTNDKSTEPVSNTAKKSSQPVSKAVTGDKQPSKATTEVKKQQATPNLLIPDLNRQKQNEAKQDKGLRSIYQ